MASGKIDPLHHKFWLSIEFLKVYLWRHSQRKDGANSTRLRPTKRNHRNHNNSLMKHHGKSPFSGCRHRPLRHCSRCTAPYLFIICLDYVLRICIDKIKENGFKLTKERSRRYPAKTITDADNADDIALLANTPAQAETLLPSLERAAAGIGFHVNSHKTEYMCFSLTSDVSTQNGTPLKLVDKFTYLGSRVTSTETDINTRLAKSWAAIDSLSVIWQSDLTDKIKNSFFQVAVVSILLYKCTT